MKLVINADAGQHTISRHIYGHFSEHLGRCIYEGYWVDPNSNIPNTQGIGNTRGIRDDVVAALKEIAVPNLRWPGGCFADEYHWMDGIGPREGRPAIVNTHWGGVTENNHFGTHEFLDLCAQLDCEPYICGNVGSGTVQELQQWVEYTTHPDGSPMADKRAANGRSEPWKVKYWGVGNENWGCGGNMRPEFYADEYRRYATFVRNFGDNKTYKIACGPNAQDYEWTEVLMRRAGGFMDGLSLHFYTVPGDWKKKGDATDFSEADWMTTMKAGLNIEELLERHIAIMDRYDPKKRVGLIVDEWGTWFDVEKGTNPGFLYQQNTMRDALVAAFSLHAFHEHCDRVHMANIAQTINVLQAMILTDGARIVKTPTFHVFEMFKVHHDATHLPLHHDISAIEGSDDKVPHLHASASRKDDKVHLSIGNLHPTQAAEVVCDVRGFDVSQASARILASSSLTEHNTFDEPNKITPQEFKLDAPHNNTVSFQLPAKSVAVIAFS